jgi:phosphoenolpyruvate carboxylase
MTENSDQLIYLKEKFKKLSLMMPDLMEHWFHNADFHIEVIPLFEEVMTMIDSVKHLEKYADAVTKMSWKKPEYLRTFLARSDPAMNVWIIPSVLWVKVTINNYKEFEKSSWIKIFPWLWAWSLPFRWNVSPDRIDDTINEYKWLDSITIQSSFRYDHNISTVKYAISKLNDELPQNREKYIRFTDKEINEIKNICNIWFEFYTKTIEKIAWIINDVAKLVPKRRERMLHVGLFWYSRWIWEIKLPRAIWFTASLYSIWIPPELIWTWRLINYLIKNNLISSVESWYLNLKKDLAYAYKFLNKENLEILSKKNDWFKMIIEDIKYIEKYLWTLAKNDNLESIIHRNETSSVLHLMLAWENFEDSIIDAAKIRKSLW